MVEEKSNVYVTRMGHEIEFLPITGLLEKARIKALAEAEEQGLMTEVPTYTFDTVGGDTDTQPMDQAVADDPKTTPEERARWEQFQADQIAIGTMIFRARLEMCLKRGIRFDYDPGGKWVEEHREWLGLDVPEDPNERRMHYIETELVSGADDMAAIYFGVVNAGVLGREEGISAWEAMFRRAQGETRRGTITEAGDQEIDVVRDDAVH